MMYSGGEIVETWKMWWICYREIFYSLLQEDYFVEGCDLCYKEIFYGLLEGDFFVRRVCWICYRDLFYSLVLLCFYEEYFMLIYHGLAL